VTERKTYLAEMMAQRGYVRDFHKVLVAEDLPFMRAVNGLMEVVYMNQRTLDRKTKELVFIGTLVGLGANKEHIRTHMEAAKREGATKQEVLEVLEMVVTPCGVPKFLVGYEVWTELYPVERVEP
jgi:4-carboxymuconolactone decarboxylase